MNPRFLLSVCAAAALAVTGCLPEKRIVWSPDGSRAAVATPNGLFFVDRTGVVQKPRLKGSATLCHWMPDGRRLAVVHVSQEVSWEALAGILPQVEREGIMAFAAEVHRRILEFTGDWDAFDLGKGDNESSETAAAALLYLRDHDAGQIREKIGPDKWKDLQDLDISIHTLQIFGLDGDALEPGQILWRSLYSLRQPLVDPQGRFVGVIRGGGVDQEDMFSLHVVAIAGGAPRLVASNVSLDFAWSPDGRNLAFIRSGDPEHESESNIHLGSLTTVCVADAEGKLLEEWTQMQDRVGLLFNQALGVEWLRDGRLMFASVEVSLPATSRDMPQQWSVFSLDPRTPASVTRVVARDFGEPVDPGLPLFEISPDEGRVLLPGPKGRLSLYEFAAGSTTVLADADDPEGKTRCLPYWRADGAVCFVRPKAGAPPKSQEVELVIWKDGTTSPFGADWPDAMKDGWLTGG
jgi:hypothetical protein